MAVFILIVVGVPRALLIGIIPAMENSEKSGGRGGGGKG